MTNEDVNSARIRGLPHSPLVTALADNGPQGPPRSSEQQLLRCLAHASRGGGALGQLGQSEDVDGLVHVDAICSVGEGRACSRWSGRRRVGGALEGY